MFARFFLLISCIALTSCAVTYENVAGSWSCSRVDGICEDIDEIDQRLIENEDLDFTPVPVAELDEDSIQSEGEQYPDEPSSGSYHSNTDNASASFDEDSSQLAGTELENTLVQDSESKPAQRQPPDSFSQQNQKLWNLKTNIPSHLVTEKDANSSSLNGLKDSPVFRTDTNNTNLSANLTVNDRDYSTEGLDHSEQHPTVDHPANTHLVEIEGIDDTPNHDLTIVQQRENSVTRSREKFAKILFAPLIDSNGNYHAERTIYIVVQPSQWILREDDSD